MSNNRLLQADPVFANSFLATTSTVTTPPGPGRPPAPQPPRPAAQSPM